MERELFGGLGSSDEPYIYKEVIDNTSFPKVEVTNFSDLSEFKEVLFSSVITETDTSGASTTTNAYSYMFDGDSTSYFQMSLGENDGESYGLTFDIGAVVTTTTLNIIFGGVVSNGSSDNMHLDIVIEISENNEDWTTLDSETFSGPPSATTESSYIKSFSGKTFRYLRIIGTNDFISGTIAGTSTQMKFYEINALSKV